MNRSMFAAIATVLLIVESAGAQHDVHRNAMHGVARGDFKWAAHQLEKADAAAENTTFTTFPRHGQPAGFDVAFGGGAGYVPKWERMWDTIRTHHPLALLMLGDNVYIDQPKHRLCQDYCYYRRQTRPEWRRLVASTATFAIIYLVRDYLTLSNRAHRI